MNQLDINKKVNVNSIIIVIKQFNSQNTFSISQIHFIKRRNSDTESHKKQTQQKRKDSSDSDEEWCPNPKKRKRKKKIQIKMN